MYTCSNCGGTGTIYRPITEVIKTINEVITQVAIGGEDACARCGALAEVQYQIREANDGGEG